MKKVLMIVFMSFVVMSVFGCIKEVTKVKETTKVEKVEVAPVAEVTILSSVRIHQKYDTGRVRRFIGNGVIVQNTKELPLLVLTDVSILEEGATMFSVTTFNGTEYNLRVDAVYIDTLLCILKSVVDVEEDGPFVELNADWLNVGDKIFTVVNSYLDETTYMATHTFIISIIGVLYNPVKLSLTGEMVNFPSYTVEFMKDIAGIVEGSGLFNNSGQLVGLRTSNGIFLFSENTIL